MKNKPKTLTPEELRRELNTRLESYTKLPAGATRELFAACIMYSLSAPRAHTSADLEMCLALPRRMWEALPYVLRDQARAQVAGELAAANAEIAKLKDNLAKAAAKAATRPATPAVVAKNPRVIARVVKSSPTPAPAAGTPAPKKAVRECTTDYMLNYEDTRLTFEFSAGHQKLLPHLQSSMSVCRNQENKLVVQGQPAPPQFQFWKLIASFVKPSDAWRWRAQFCAHFIDGADRSVWAFVLSGKSMQEMEHCFEKQTERFDRPGNEHMVQHFCMNAPRIFVDMTWQFPSASGVAQMGKNHPAYVGRDGQQVSNTITPPAPGAAPAQDIKNSVEQKRDIKPPTPPLAEPPTPPGDGGMDL